ncbi:protein of unknown function [Sphingopyxis indica]|uniref:DUF1963 domain-containing protein n=1 Tax=Sphingopyxis indica TaxID=436663 RepID=A0A239K3K4_9SPHN|nr:protein of unknown function [Sphingopyxis indica]
MTLAGVSLLFLLIVFLVWRIWRQPAAAAPMASLRDLRLPAFSRAHGDAPEVEIAPSRLARIRGEMPAAEPEIEGFDNPAPSETYTPVEAGAMVAAAFAEPEPAIAAALADEALAAERRADFAAPNRDTALQVRLMPQIPPRDAILTRSRLGGRPRLPADMDWPRIDGVKGDFLAQIACADLPADLWDGLGPRTGWLAIFAHPETGVGSAIHVAEEGPPREPPQGAGNALFGPWGGLRFGDLATLAIRAFPEWPVDVVAGAEAPPAFDDTLASDAVEYDIADPAFHPFDWDSMRMLGAVLDRRIARLQTGTGAPADASDEYLAALADAAETNRATAAGATEIVAIIRDSAGQHEFTPSDATAVMAALHAVRWKHVLCYPDPETGEDRIETLTLPLTRHDPRAPLWAHDYRALLLDAAKHAWLADPARLSAPARAWFEPLWRQLAAAEAATMGGAPSQPLVGFDPDYEAVLIELPTSGLMSRLVGEGENLVLTIRKADLAAGDFSKVATRRTRA